MEGEIALFKAGPRIKQIVPQKLVLRWVDPKPEGESSDPRDWWRLDVLMLNFGE
jgi:hypothetical protein